MLPPMARMSRISAILVCLIVAASPARADPAADCQQSSDLESQIAACSAVLADSPRNADAFEPTALAYRERADILESIKHDHKAALADLNKALEIDVNDESAKAAIAAIEKQKLAEQCTLAPSPKARWDAFTEILVKNPNDFAAHYQRGLAAASAGNVAGAVIDFAIAVNIDPKSWPARFNLGTAYATEQKFDLAVEQFNRAIELYPKLAQAYYARGVTLSKLKKPDEAIADHSKAIELNPKLLLCEPRESL